MDVQTITLRRFIQRMGVVKIRVQNKVGERHTIYIDKRQIVNLWYKISVCNLCVCRIFWNLYCASFFNVRFFFLC